MGDLARVKRPSAESRKQVHKALPTGSTPGARPCYSSSSRQSICTLHGFSLQREIRQQAGLPSDPGAPTVASKLAPAIGEDLFGLAQSSIAEQFAAYLRIVPQKPLVLGDNVSFGAPEADRAEKRNVSVQSLLNAALSDSEWGASLLEKAMFPDFQAISGKLLDDDLCLHHPVTGAVIGCDEASKLEPTDIDPEATLTEREGCTQKQPSPELHATMDNIMTAAAFSERLCPALGETPDEQDERKQRLERLITNRYEEYPAFTIKDTGAVSVSDTYRHYADGSDADEARVERRLKVFKNFVHESIHTYEHDNFGAGLKKYYADSPAKIRPIIEGTTEYLTQLVMNQVKADAAKRSAIMGPDAAKFDEQEHDKMFPKPSYANYLATVKQLDGILSSAGAGEEAIPAAYFLGWFDLLGMSDAGPEALRGKRFSGGELERYRTERRQTGEPARGRYEDDKARQLTELAGRHNTPFTLDTVDKVNLINQMLHGVTGNPDETAILSLLESMPPDELRSALETCRIRGSRLLLKFQGPQRGQLLRLMSDRYGWSASDLRKSSSC